MRRLLFDYAGLLPRDAGQGGAQNLGMIAADIGRDGQARVQHVGGIKPTAETGFDDGDVYFGAGEMLEGQSGIELEEGDLSSGQFGTMAIDESGHRTLRNHTPVDPYSLAQRNQVRGSEQSGLVAGLLQNRGQHRGRGALAVGPGQMDRSVAILRRTDVGQEAGDILQP